MNFHAHKFYHLNIFKSTTNVKNTFLEGTITPTIIFTGNYTGFNPPAEFNNLNSKFIKKLNKKGLHIYLYEPLCLYTNKEHNRSFYSEFPVTADLSNIRANELDSVEEFIKKYNLTNVTVYTCDYNVSTYIKNYPFKLECRDLFVSDASQDIHIIEKGKNISKPFWSANGRYTMFRHLVMSYLVNYNGNYTWHFRHTTNPLQDNVWLDISKLDDNIKSKVTTGFYRLIDNYFYIFDKRNKERQKVKSHSGVVGPTWQLEPSNINFVESYKECFVGVISETRYAQPTGNFSEKTLQCIGARTPFILAAPPYTLEYLKTLGFKTFSKYWSEDYDTIEDPTERFVAITALIDEIGNMTIKEMTRMYNDMSNIIEHNVNVLKSLP